MAENSYLEVATDVSFDRLKLNTPYIMRWFLFCAHHPPPPIAYAR